MTVDEFEQVIEGVNIQNVDDLFIMSTILEVTKLKLQDKYYETHKEPSSVGKLYINRVIKKGIPNNKVKYLKTINHDLYIIDSLLPRFKFMYESMKYSNSFSHLFITECNVIIYHLMSTIYNIECNLRDNINIKVHEKFVRFKCTRKYNKYKHGELDLALRINDIKDTYTANINKIDTEYYNIINDNSINRVCSRLGASISRINKSIQNIVSSYILENNAYIDNIHNDYKLIDSSIEQLRRVIKLINKGNFSHKDAEISDK